MQVRRHRPRSNADRAACRAMPDRRHCGAVGRTEWLLLSCGRSLNAHVTSVARAPVLASGDTRAAAAAAAVSMRQQSCA